MKVVREMLEAELARCRMLIDLLPDSDEYNLYMRRIDYIERLLEVEC
jgi:hypothetical protein